MVNAQRHRGPDAEGIFCNDISTVALAHNRLSILDLSDAGRQPMSDIHGRRWITLNGEIYNYVELRQALGEYQYKSRTDTEVLLAAFDRWGPECLDRLIGMFAFAVWDEQQQRLFAARDRFGVKPFFYHQRPDGTLVFASEIKALRCAGVHTAPDPVTWATYLSTGVSDSSPRTFWTGIQSLPPGHCLTWQGGKLQVRCWYDLAERSGRGLDRRPLKTVQDEYRSLLDESIRLRFRSDVPVGINLSGGLDSSALLGLVDDEFGADNQVKVFTYVTGDPRYDELPWVQQMLRDTKHPLSISTLTSDEVPELAEKISVQQDEPFGGLPTLAYAKVFQRARSEGVTVLLDGQGMDEQWAGYDYYRRAIHDQTVTSDRTGTVQGTRQESTRPECLTPEFRALAERSWTPQPFSDALRNLQYRDARFTKIPKAVRFNDRVSMMSSTELREPFLDHRLFELALRQPAERKIVGRTGKWTLRQIAQGLLPRHVSEAPKRPLQTPQREWLRGRLRDWAADCIESAVRRYGGHWLDADAVRREWQLYLDGASDNSSYVWQWISVGLSNDLSEEPSTPRLRVAG